MSIRNPFPKVLYLPLHCYLLVAEFLNKAAPMSTYLLLDRGIVSEADERGE